MKTSTKIWLALAGVLFIVLGIACICSPGAALFTTAWVLGLTVLISGISRLVFAIDTQAFLPNSGSRVLSGILQIVIGIIFLCNVPFLSAALPVIFIIWILIESIIIAVQSFDYKQVGFSLWWVILLLGVAGIALGVAGLRNFDTSATIFVVFVGVALILAGVAYLCALRGLSHFSKRIENFRRTIGADEQ